MQHIKPSIDVRFKILVGAPLFFPLDGQTKGGVVVGTTHTSHSWSELLPPDFALMDMVQKLKKLYQIQKAEGHFAPFFLSHILLPHFHNPHGEIVKND